MQIEYAEALQWARAGLSRVNLVEKAWGNKVIGQVNNNQWTTKLGEELVRLALVNKGYNVRKPLKIGGYKPDWECDEFIYEVKTRNWTTSGTAGEKVFGVPFKYSDIPRLYSKPLKIVCVAFQEYELTYGPSCVFGEVSPEKKKLLDFWREEFNIEFVKFTDLARGGGTLPL